MNTWDGSAHPNGNVKIFSGNANKRLAEEICDHLGIDLGKAHVGRFNDDREVRLVANGREYAPVSSWTTQADDMYTFACPRAKATGIIARASGTVIARSRIRGSCCRTRVSPRAASGCAKSGSCKHCCGGRRDRDGVEPSTVRLL